LIGRQLSIIIAEAAMRAVGIDPIITCGANSDERCAVIGDTY
jgi:hypothetical protein